MADLESIKTSKFETYICSFLSVTSRFSVVYSYYSVPSLLRGSSFAVLVHRVIFKKNFFDSLRITSLIGCAQSRHSRSPCSLCLVYLRVVSVVQYIICDCSTVLLTLTMTVSDCVQNEQNRKHFNFPCSLSFSFQKSKRYEY